MESERDPLGAVRSFTYDPAGNMIVAVDATGAVTTYAYDPSGRRTSMTDATGTTTYAYDPAGRLTREQSPRGVLAHTYDRLGNTTSTTYPDATVVTYAYDPAGRLVGIATPGGEVTYAWDAASRLVAEDLPEGTSRTYGYEAGRLARFTQRIDGEDTQTTTLTYDAAGRRSTERRGGTLTSYAYDAAGQLTGVSGGDEGDGNDTAFTHDAAGNRTSMRQGNTTTTYSYDEGRLVRAASKNKTTTYTYDPAGRRTTQSRGNETTTYAYDASGRLSTLTTTKGGQTTSQARTYDGDGALVGVGTTDGDDDGGDATTFVWDATAPVREIAVVREGGVDTNLVYGVGRALALRAGEVTVFASDVSGSAIADEDDEDALVRAHAYDAFGNPQDASAKLGVTFGYRGEAHIGELVHLRARDYDPATGTFTTRDPLEGLPGEPASGSAYAYGANDPINRVDPLGLLSFSDVTGAIGGVVGGARDVIGGAVEAVTDFPGNWVELWEDFGGDQVDAFIDKYGYIPSTGEIVQILFNPGWNFLDSCVGQGSKFSVLDCGLATADLAATGVALGTGTLRVVRQLRWKGATTNTVDDALAYATRAEKLDHIFVPRHNLDPLVQQLGSREAVVQQMLNGVRGLTPASGTFEIPVTIGGQTDVIRGAVVNGVIKIGTAFTP